MESTQPITITIVEQAIGARPEIIRMQRELDESEAKRTLLKADLEDARETINRLRSGLGLALRTMINTDSARHVMFPVLLRHGFEDWTANGLSLRVMIGTLAGSKLSIKYGFKVKVLASNRFEISTKVSLVDFPIPEFADHAGVPRPSVVGSTLHAVHEMVTMLLKALPLRVTNDTLNTFMVNSDERVMKRMSGAEACKRGYVTM